MYQYLGDSRSPAFGDLNGYRMSLKQDTTDCLKLWGSPETIQDIFNLFSDYCMGKVMSLPWCDGPLAPESLQIRDKLALINKYGFLTINSQPAVDGM